MRFAVSNRVEADARLAQTECGPPRAEAFVEPRDLDLEQRALYRAAARGYLGEFGAVAARAVDLGFRTKLGELGAELVSNPGVAVEREDGGHELRKLLVGARRDGSLLDDVDVRLNLVRTAEWARDDLAIVAVDLIEQRRTEYRAHLERERALAHEWIAERVALVLELAADGRPRAGRDCQGCAYIAGCVEHEG
jgi:hypothetical protein